MKIAEPDQCWRCSNAHDDADRETDCANSYGARETALFKSGDRVRISNRLTMSTEHAHHDHTPIITIQVRARKEAASSLNARIERHMTGVVIAN
jgi:hypothetical protein